jgi:hypothetical protein
MRHITNLPLGAYILMFFIQAMTAMGSITWGQCLKPGTLVFDDVGVVEGKPFQAKEVTTKEMMK